MGSGVWGIVSDTKVEPFEVSLLCELHADILALGINFEYAPT